MTCGVYFIECAGRRYVGSSADVEQRWKKHAQRLQRQSHPNSYLQNLFNKHGASELKYSLIQETSVEHLLAVEQAYLDWNAHTNRSCNIASLATSPMRGRKHSAQAREQMTASRTGSSVPSKWKPICAVDLEGLKAYFWPSVNHAEKQGFARSKIASCIRGRRRRYRGLVWSLFPYLIDRPA